MQFITRFERGLVLYLEHWNLELKPFENLPDPRFFFYSPEHKTACERLRYAILERKGGALLTGEVGCGKTTLLHMLVRELSTQEYEIGVINNPKLDHVELLKEILYQLTENNCSEGYQLLSRKVGDLLYDTARRGKHVLLLIDEAQLLKGSEPLEELRLLLNYQMEDRFLITTVLAGQPELRRRVKDMPHLEQRLSVRYHLHRFDEVQTARYIEHRIEVAGSRNRIFTGAAIQLIYKDTCGVPRRINNLCDLCLLDGAARGAPEVDEDIVRGAIS